MKRIGRILSLTVILTVLATMFCFAAPAGDGTLVLNDTYPKDGATGTAVENMGVKLYFDATFTQEKLKNANENAVTLLDEQGKKLPTQVLYSVQEPGVVLVLFDNMKQTDDVKINQNEEYTFKISKDFRDDNGNILGKEETISFKTLNQSANMAINTAMMFGVFGVMMIMTARNAKKKGEQQNQKEEKVNPYKEAKKTGKSVEEIVEKDQKEKAKRAAKAAKKAAAEEDDDDYYDDGNYHVRGPRPIAAAGGRYITGRKAIAEAKKAEEERRKAQKAKAKGKGKKK